MAIRFLRIRIQPGLRGCTLATSDGTNPISPGQVVGDPGHPDTICGVTSHVCFQDFIELIVFNSFCGGSSPGTSLFVLPYASSNPAYAG